MFVAFSRRRAAALKGDRGAVAVEAAFIFPVLIFILFGIIEFSLVLRDHVAITSAVRAGARTASAEPRMSTFDSDAAATVLRAGTGMPMSTVQEVWIYEATNEGYPLGTAANSTTPFDTCTTNCVKYTYHAKTAGTAATLTKSSGTWLYTAVNACQGEVMTNVGIFLKAHHGFATGLAAITLTDHAVMRFEPIPANQLAAGQSCK